MKQIERGGLDGASRAAQAASHETAVAKDADNARPFAAWYRIVVRGHLDGHRSDWFDGLAVRRLQDGETALEGGVRDQSELYGHLIRLRDLGLTLMSVSRVETQELAGKR